MVVGETITLFEYSVYNADDDDDNAQNGANFWPVVTIDNDAPNPGTGVTNDGTLTELSQLNITVEESSAAGYKEIRLVHKKLYVTLELYIFKIQSSRRILRKEIQSQSVFIPLQ